MSKEQFTSRESKEVKNLPLSVVEDYFRKLNEYENLTSEKRTIMEQYYGWEKMPGRNEKIMENFKRQWDEIENQLNSLRKSLDDMREKNPALLDVERYFFQGQEYNRLSGEILKLYNEEGEIVLKRAEKDGIKPEEAREKLKEEMPSYYKDLLEQITELQKKQNEVRMELEDLRKILPGDVVKRLESKIRAAEKKEKQSTQVAQREKVTLDESQQKEEKIIQESKEQVDKSEIESEKKQEEKESEAERIVLKGQKIELEYPGEPIDIYLGDKHLQIVDVRNKGIWNATYLIIDPDNFDRAKGKGFKGIRENEPFVLGRHSPHRFEFPPTVSRRHVMINLVGGKLIIEDLGSTNGTIIEIKKKRGESKSLGEALKRAAEFIEKLNLPEQEKDKKEQEGKK
jgi:hypothetical protein